MLRKHKYLDSSINNFPVDYGAVELSRRFLATEVHSISLLSHRCWVLMKELVINKDQKLLCKFRKASSMIKNFQKIVTLAAGRKQQ